MDFEASGIGLQQLFGLKCLRSDLVFIIMYFPFCVCFFFLFVFCSIDFFFLTGHCLYKLWTVGTWNLKSFNINPSYCNLIVLLLFLTNTVHLHIFFSLTNCLHYITVFLFSFFLLFFFLNIPAQVWCASLWMCFSLLVCFHTKRVVAFSDCQWNKGSKIP